MRFLMLNWRDPMNPLAGGAERVSVAYMGELVRRGHEVFWFANDFPGARPQETLEGITYIRGGGKGSSVLRAVKWYRKQPPFDLVIDQHHGIPWYAPWWCGTNCIAYIHEVLGPIWKSFYPEPLASIGRWQERWTHGRYRNIPFWTPSESTKQSLLGHGIREVKVIPNGCDTVPLAELPPKPLQSPVRLIVVCRLAANKRVDHTLRTLRVLLDQGVAAALTVVGRGDAEASLRRMATELRLEERVAFTGALSEREKNDHLRNAHLLLHTSVREGWGLNVLEANAMGTPAVVYPVGGLVDSTVDGVSGRITKEETAEAVAGEIVKLLESPATYDSLRVNAWLRCAEYQWSRVLPLATNWLEMQAARQPGTNGPDISC